MTGVELFTLTAATATTAAVPFTLADAFLVVGTLASAAGAVQQGQAASSQADFQAAVQRQQAESEKKKAASEEEDFRARQSRVLAARRAALGASGVDQSTGSPLLVAEDFASETELGALRIRSGGKVKATRLEQQAGLQRLQGSAAQSAGFARSGALLLTGAGKTFS